MKSQPTPIYASLLAIVIAFGVAGVAMRAHAEGQAASTQGRDRDDRREERRRMVESEDRRVIRVDGRGSQIGVFVSDPDAAAEQGVTIDRVDEDGAAQKAGVQSGDRVVEFDGEKVRSARQLTRLVQETPSGRAVKMTVLRGSDRRTLDITPQTDAPVSFDRRVGPAIELEIERGLERGLRGLPDRFESFFDFRPDGGGSAIGARGRLGVQVQALNDQLAAYFGVTGGGVLVTGVTADSPAAKAGLTAGDVITKVNGRAVTDAGDLIGALGDVKDDGAVTLDIVRDKKLSTVKTTLAAPGRAARRRSARPA